MGFHVGDKVIHCTYGLGEIVQIEQKIIQRSPYGLLCCPYP